MQYLSYRHIDLLVDMDDETKRSFYEIESIRGNWSVRELKRQKKGVETFIEGKNQRNRTLNHVHS